MKALEEGNRLLNRKKTPGKGKNKFSVNGTNVGCPEKENADIGMFVAYFFVITW
jgi:hypothetical protein